MDSQTFLTYTCRIIGGNPPSTCTTYTVTLPDTVTDYSVDYVDCSGNLMRVLLTQIIAVDNEDGTITYSVCVQNGTSTPVFIQNNQAVLIGYNWQAGGPCSF